jgi:hypothetical protein
MSENAASVRLQNIPHNSIPSFIFSHSTNLLSRDDSIVIFPANTSNKVIN